ncbi:hypothetical protein SOVF_181540, partial [Spinacia oleracea]
MQDTMARTKKTANIADLRLRGQQMDPSFSGGRSIKVPAGEISRTPPGETSGARQGVTHFDEFWMEEMEDVGPSKQPADSFEESEPDESDGEAGGEEALEEEAGVPQAVAGGVQGENAQVDAGHLGTDPKWLKWIERHGENYAAGMNTGPGYEMRFPEDEA